MIQLYQGDCLEEIKKIPDKSVDLVLTDPPYNIGKADWDKIEGYIDWCAEWIKECARVLKDNGSMYIWHNDMPQLAELMGRIKKDGIFAYVSFCIWDKTEAYRARSWKQRDAKGKTALRSWFNRCEYCVEFAKIGGVNTAWDRTGRDRINSNTECYKPIKNWYRDEMTRLGIDEKQIAEAYEKAMKKKPYMLRHYFRDSQFEIPTRAVWEGVYMPLGFDKSYEDLRESYEDLRESYEDLRYYHRCDEKHSNRYYLARNVEGEPLVMLSDGLMAPAVIKPLPSKTAAEICNYLSRIGEMPARGWTREEGKTEEEQLKGQINMDEVLEGNDGQ